MKNQLNAKPDYGNWVSKRLVYSSAIIGAVLLILPFFTLWLLIIPSLLFFLIAAYFAYARYLFSAKGGNVQDKVWETVISSLDWQGDGKALDIGCGNGALTIKLGRKFPAAKVTGIDYWGERWEYTKDGCEANAKAEGVEDHVVFQKASASKLPFADGYFDAAVSNLCFHEVADTKDKREIILEALRVVKKGGKFAFQDLFLLKQVYGEPEELVATIKGWGMARVEFMETRNQPFVPTALKLPFMIGRMGIIKGEK